MKKRILSILLCFVMVVGLMPSMAWATGTGSDNTGKAIRFHTDGISDPTEKTESDSKVYYEPNSYIYFGVNSANESAPIKWRVLDADADNMGEEGSMFLLSENVLASGVQFSTTSSNTYYNNNAWQWCKSFRSPEGVATANFSSTEKDAMSDCDKDDEEKTLYNIAWGTSNVPYEEMFFLSAEELASYVADYNSGSGLIAKDADEAARDWWLRSPGADAATDGTALAGYVSETGVVSTEAVSAEKAARPAMNLETSKIHFISAAEGGKSADGMESGLTAVSAYNGNEWKLTILDEDREFMIGSVSQNENGAYTFSYESAETGTNEYISAVIMDTETNEITHYGRILQLDGTTNQATGNVTLTLPDGVSLSKTTKLYVFNEQYNGDRKTDIASALKQVKVSNHKNHCVCGAEHTAIGDHKEEQSVEWTEWTDALAKSQNGSGSTASNSLPKKSGNYYLTGDVTTEVAWEQEMEIVLCLNGYSITSEDDVAISLLLSTFTLTDCNGSGEGNGIVTTTVKDATTGATGWGVQVAAATFNMYAGEITGNNITLNTPEDICGGGVYLINGEGNRSTFNMYGGKITENEVKNTGSGNAYGGGVYVQIDTDFNMYGGEISGNTAEAASGNAYGGGVYVDELFYALKNEGEKADATNAKLYWNSFNLYGGKITGNTVQSAAGAACGGGVYADNGAKFTVSGAVQITGNTAGEAANNVQLYPGGTKTNVAVMVPVYYEDEPGKIKEYKTETLDVKTYSADTITIGEALSNDARIGISAALEDGEGESVSFATGATSNKLAYTTIFTSDKDGYTISLTADGTLDIAEKTVPHEKHCVCGATHTAIGDHESEKVEEWTAWTEKASLPTTAGYYYLTKNVTLTGTWNPANGTYLCLNGKKITGPNGSLGSLENSGDAINVAEGVSLTITDCHTGDNVGKITHAAGTTGRGIYNDEGTLTLWNGSITGNSKASYGSGVYNDEGATFTMYGGSIKGNTSGTSGGGGVYNYEGTFTMYDGSIAGNSASFGGGVYNFGKLEMKGGSIEDNKGGGVGNGSQFTMNGGTISGNTSEGGVYNTGIFTMNDGTISGNKNDDDDFSGGGVCNNHGTFTMNGGTISGNTGADTGGGVANRGTFKMTGGDISGNSSRVYGGGVHNLYSNDNEKTATFTMTGGTISGNSSQYGGGGVFNQSSDDAIATFTMTGGTISGNNSVASGGGVFNMGTFNVSGTPVIKDNVQNGTKGADGVYTGGTANNVYVYVGDDNTIYSITVETAGMKSGAKVYVNGEVGDDILITATTSPKGFYCDTVGCGFVSDGNSGLKIAEKHDEAQIGDDVYGTLGEALDAASENTTDDTIEIIGTTVTEVTNKTLKAGDTLKDSSNNKYKATEDSTIAVDTTALVTLNSGKLEVKAADASSATLKVKTSAAETTATYAEVTVPVGKTVTVDAGLKTAAVSAGESVTIDGVKFTAKADGTGSAFSLETAKLINDGDKAEIPNGKSAAITLGIGTAPVVTVSDTTTNTGSVTVEKTSTGGKVTVEKNGDKFTIGEKTYTASCVNAVYTVTSDGSAILTFTLDNLPVDGYELNTGESVMVGNYIYTAPSGNKGDVKLTVRTDGGGKALNPTVVLKNAGGTVDVAKVSSDTAATTYTAVNKNTEFAMSESDTNAKSITLLSNDDSSANSKIEIPSGVTVNSGSDPMTSAADHTVISLDSSSNAVLESGAASTTGTMYAVINGKTRIFGTAEDNTVSYSVNATNNTLSLNSNVTVTDYTNGNGNAPQFTGATFVFLSTADDGTITGQLAGGASVMGKDSNGEASTITGVNNANTKVTIGKDGSVCLIGGVGQSAGVMDAKMGGNDTTFTFESKGSKYTVDTGITPAQATDGVLTLDEAGTVTVDNKVSFGGEENAEFTLSKSGSVITAIISDEAIVRNGSNDTIKGVAKTEDGKATKVEIGSNGALTLIEGKGIADGLETVYAKVSDTTTVAVIVPTGVYATIDLDNVPPAVKDLSDGKSVTIGGVTYTAVDGSAFPLNGSTLTKIGETAVVPAGTTADVKLGNDTTEPPYTAPVVTVPSTNQGNTTVTKGEPSTVVLEKQGDTFAVGGKTYTAGSDETEFTIDGNGNVTMTGGTVKLNDGESITGGSGKVITNPTDTDGDQIVVNVKKSTGIDTVTVPASGKVKIGDTEYENASGTASMTIAVATGGNVTLTGGVVNLDQNESINVGGERIENISDKTVTVKANDPEGGKNSVVVPAGGKATIGDATYKAGNEAATFVIDAEGKVTLADGEAVLDDGDSVTGKSGKTITKPTGSGEDTITVTVDADNSKDTVTVPASGKGSIGGTEYENASTTETMTIEVDANGNKLTAGAVTLDKNEAIKVGDKDTTVKNTGDKQIKVTADGRVTVLKDGQTTIGEEKITDVGQDTTFAIGEDGKAEFNLGENETVTVNGVKYTGLKTTDDKTVTAEEKTTPSIPTDAPLSADDKTAIESVINKAKVQGVTEAVAGSMDTLLKEFNIDTTTDVAKINVDIDVKVELTKADLSEDTTQTMTYTAKPVATVTTRKADGTENKAENVDVPNSLLSEEMTVRLPLPTGFEPNQIKHSSSDGSVEYFLKTSARGAKTFTIDEDNCAVFTITKFSTFELSGTVTYVEPHSSGGNKSTTYAVSVNKTANGSVSVSSGKASKGTTVTITANPDSGYLLSGLTVIDKDGSKVELTKKGNNEYTFIMPATGVSVEGSFVKVNTWSDCSKDATCPIEKFADVVNTEWYHDGVHYCLDNGLMVGTSETSFSPDANITRGQIVTMLWRKDGSPAASGGDFADVASTAYYAQAIGWAASNDVVTGYGDEKFGPDDSITREQLAAILYRYAKYKGMDVSVGEDTNILDFDDAQSISTYAIPAIQWACGAGIMNGTDTLKLSPKATATRAQAASMMQRFLTENK